MRIKILLLLTTPILFWGCASQFAALQNNRQQDIALEELRVEVADLKHALHASEVEMHILEEKLETKNQTDHLSENLSSIQRKLALLERNQDKLAGEIRTLTAHANQTTTSLSQFRDQISEIDHRFEDLKGLKNTLSSISKSIDSKLTYKVKAGDSLEKIAKKYHVSIETIKEMNHLQSDRIIVGQELILPNG